MNVPVITTAATASATTTRRGRRRGERHIADSRAVTLAMYRRVRNSD